MSDHNSGAFKLVPFWPDDPELWFAQTEAVFFNFNITDDLRKFKYIIPQLDKHCLNVIRDIALSPPASNKYETLKSELFNRLKSTKIKNIKEILTTVDVGDRKPSEFLQHLKGLAGPDVDDKYIKSVWSSRLHVKVQWVASFLTSSSLEKIAQLADLAMNSPSMKPPENKSQPSKVGDTKPLVNQDVTIELTRRVAELTKKVEDISLTLDKNGKVCTLSNSIAHDGSTTKMASTMSLLTQNPTYSARSNLLLEPVFCWYHAQYFQRATKCIPPCDFQHRRLYQR